MPAYDAFLKQYPNTHAYASEFLRNSSVLSYDSVMEKIPHEGSDSFYIMWNLSAVSDGISSPSFSPIIAAVSKADLLFMLHDQKNDMEDSKLIYCRNMERITFWDMIIFDDSFSWALAITHEDNEDGSRMCFSAVI